MSQVKNTRILNKAIISIVIALAITSSKLAFAGEWDDLNSSSGSTSVSSSNATVSIKPVINYKVVRDKADNYYSSGNYNKSLQLFYKLHDSNNLEDKYHSLIMLSKIYKVRGDYAQSVNFANKSKLLSNKVISTNIDNSARIVYKVQVFLSESLDKATSAKYQLIEIGYINAFIETERAKDGTLFHHVYSGKYPTKKRAHEVKRLISKSKKLKDYKKPFVVDPK